MSWGVDASVKGGGGVTDGNVGGPYLLPHAVLQSLLGTGLDFSRVTKNSWRFCSSRTTSFAAFLLMLSSKSISSVLQPSLSGPNSVERLCRLAQQVRSVTLTTI
jgi:hypothetical protein